MLAIYICSFQLVILLFSICFFATGYIHSDEIKILEIDKFLPQKSRFQRP